MNEFFIPRSKEPEKTNEFYYSDKNIFQRDGYGMPNCTAYAHGRYAELTGVWLPCWGNAETWYDTALKNDIPVGSTPRLGAVACWSVGDKTTGKDGAGHVAIVEAITPTGDIITSNSAWKSTNFYTDVAHINKKYNWKSKISGNEYKLEGFIYTPTFFKEDTYLKRVKDKCYLYSSANASSAKVLTLFRNNFFVYDGIYYVAQNTKWLHGYVVVGSEHKTGWIKANKVTDEYKILLY